MARRARWFREDALERVPRLRIELLLAVLLLDAAATIGYHAWASDALAPLARWTDGLVRPGLIWGAAWMVVTIGGLLLAGRRLRPHHLGLSRGELGRWLAALAVLGGAIQLVVLAAAWVAGPSRIALGAPSMGSLGELAAQILATGPGEEILWRGVVLSQLWHRLRGAMSPAAAMLGAVAGTSAGFALTHLPMLLHDGRGAPAILATEAGYIAMGFAFAALYLRSGSLLTAAAVHALFNAPTPFASLDDDSRGLLQAAVLAAAFAFVALGPRARGSSPPGPR